VLRAQVMKMLMPLLSPAAGRIAFQLPEGAVLSAGDLIARLDLDDANAVTADAPFTLSSCKKPCFPAENE
jgi:acetyl-CoA carboxylase/biotin carboxylase 1